MTSDTSADLHFFSISCPASLETVSGGNRFSTYARSACLETEIDLNVGRLLEWIENWNCIGQESSLLYPVTSFPLLLSVSAINAIPPRVIDGNVNRLDLHRGELV